MQILLEYFLLGVFIASIILYFTYPDPKVIIKYPSLDDSVSDLYVDDNNICYRYHKKEVKCNAKNNIM
jgi:hypothetical protein